MLDPDCLDYGSSGVKRNVRTQKPYFATEDDEYTVAPPLVEAFFGGLEVGRDYKASNSRETYSWRRRDSQSTRLQLPGDTGPSWETVTKRVTQDARTGRVLDSLLTQGT